MTLCWRGTEMDATWPPIDDTDPPCPYKRAGWPIYAWRRDALWTGVSVVVAFAASGWFRIGATKPLLTLGWTLGHLLAATCIALLLGGLVKRRWERWVGAASGVISFLAVIAVGTVWPWRGVACLAAPVLPGFAVATAAVVLGIRGSLAATAQHRAYVVLTVLGMAVLGGLIDLESRPSPERAAREFARAVADQRWSHAFALLSPERRQKMRRAYESSPEVIGKLLVVPRRLVLDRVWLSGTDAHVELFRPRSHWGHGSSFGRFDDLTVQEQPSGRWLVSGKRHVHLLDRLMFQEGI